MARLRWMFTDSDRAVLICAHRDRIQASSYVARKQWMNCLLSASKLLKAVGEQRVDLIEVQLEGGERSADRDQ